VCHQSVGLIARVVEKAGIPTLCMTSALDITASVKAPRAVFVNFPLGHQTGKPNQPEIQRRIVLDAMAAFETITKPGEIVRLPYVWDPNDRSWEEIDYTKGWMPVPPSREEADHEEVERRARFAGK
jgi:D-proline reductase (dithiol) PrdB